VEFVGGFGSEIYGGRWNRHGEDASYIMGPVEAEGERTRASWDTAPRDRLSAPR